MSTDNATRDVRRDAALAPLAAARTTPPTASTTAGQKQLARRECDETTGYAADNRHTGGLVSIRPKFATVDESVAT